MRSVERVLTVFCRGLLHSGLTGGSLIAEVLLLNADVLGVAASPLMDFEEATLYVSGVFCLLLVIISFRDGRLSSLSNYYPLPSSLFKL